MIAEAGRREAPAADAPLGTASWRNVALLVALLGAVAALYAVGVLLPYYVNDLDRLPLSVVDDGGHDPKGLWPQSGWAVPVQLAGLFALAFGPLVALAGLGVAVAWLVSLWRRPADARGALSLALLVVAAAHVAALLFLLSDTGVGLMAWRLD